MSNQVTKDIIIVGTEGFGREIAWHVERINDAAVSKGEDAAWELEGFLAGESHVPQIDKSPKLSRRAS